MIPARDELHHLVDCLTDAECELALARLSVFQNPRCPSCGEAHVDDLVWQEDEETVVCGTCGFAWQPDHELVHRP